jgi:hypothetical protein
MKTGLVILIGIILISIPQSYADGTDSGGYLKINSVDISLKSGYADVSVNYVLEDAFRFIALMFGENDLRSKIKDQLGFGNVSIISMNYTNAHLIVYDVQSIYGEGLYWFPAHEFNTEIPNLTIRTNQSFVQYNHTSKLEDGIVYY